MTVWDRYKDDTTESNGKDKKKTRTGHSFQMVFQRLLNPTVFFQTLTVTKIQQLSAGFQLPEK